jgi:signal transduction histidine kinase
VTRECRITHADGTSAFDFRVTAAPLVADGTPYTVLSLEDVSDANRKRALERIFFHDIMNTAGSMRNLLELVPAEMPGGGDADLLDSVRRAADILVDEILGQKQLFAAETGDLQVVPKPVEVRSFLEQAVIRWSGLDVAKRRIIELRKGPDGTVSTDPALLHRCLTNMVKNAVESASRGDTVTVWWEWESRRLLLKVRNPGVMPPDVQLQVFQRSFSTKGVGRGIGTYSMKLLGEAYLGGTVSFTSTESDGTVFTLALPRGGTPAGEGSAR